MKISPLKGFLLQRFHKSVYLLQFRRDVDALRTVRVALAATGAAVGLAETGNTAVIAYQEGAACLAVILVLAVLRHVALVDAAVVVQQDGWNIQSIGARHTVFAVVARHGGVLQHSLGGIFQQGKLLFRTWNKRGEGTQVVLQMLHVRHSAVANT